MASVSLVRAGLATQLATITGWQTYARPPGDVIVPCAVVVPAEPALTFDETFGRGADTLHFRVVVLVGNPDDELAQVNLDGYLAGSGATSVKAAIEASATLGGVSGVSYAIVTAVTQYGEVTYAGMRYCGAEFAVDVCASGS